MAGGFPSTQRGNWVSREEFERLLRRVDGMENTSGSGLFVSRSPLGVHFAAEETAISLLWGRITGSTLLSANRWEYEFEEVAPTDGGDFDTGARSRTGICHNSLESMNSATGVQGNGVDVDNLPQNWEMKPCPEGAVVLIIASGGYYRFSYENGVDGEC
jgi:hypothetical protein